jgi:hypothetical protein
MVMVDNDPLVIRFFFFPLEYITSFNVINELSLYKI